MKRTTSAMLVVICVITTSMVASAQDKPNIVLVFMDNFGWGEPGFNGGGIIRGAATPRLDQIASEGLRLTNFNVEVQCTPSRSAIMTGRYAIRSGNGTVPLGEGVYGLVQWEVTMAEMLSDAGYATGMYGKWHLGRTEGRFPTDQGFDEWYGIPNTTDEALYTSHHKYDPSVSVQPYIVEATKGSRPTPLEPYDMKTRPLIDRECTERAIAFMTRNVKAGKPFFAFVPYTHAHLPTTAHPDFAGKSGHGPYADVLQEIDHNTGQILDAIDDLGIRDQTVVLWLSDNGPEEIEGYHGTAGYWRGNYFTALEGSLRVPAIMRWPGEIEADQISNEVVHMVDMLPTLARIAGAAVPQDRIIDGVDQLDFLTGDQQKSNREGFPVFNGDDLFAYKWRNWKMHFIELDSMFGKPARLNMPHLHNLITDPKELYPADKVDPSASWVFPVVLKKVVEFKQSLAMEPPIPLGTPDPYEPAQR